MHRFFISSAQFTNENISLDGEIAHQLSRVLRLLPGARILLLDGAGNEAEAELTSVPKTGPVLLKIVGRRLAEGEPAIKVTLYQALLKGEKFDWVLQKGTELGISSFVPVLTERCISENARLERWQKIVREAAEQSRRGILPQVSSPISFKEAISQMATTPLALLAWEEEQTQPLRLTLNSFQTPPTEVAVLIGPEGGLTSAEAQHAKTANIKVVGLGKRILRAETAGPTAAALVLFHFAQMD